MPLRSWLRRSEILGLKWEAVDFDSGVIQIRNTIVRVSHVHEEDSTKTSAGSRSLQLFPAARQCLQQMLSHQRENMKWYGNAKDFDTEHVFVSEHGQVYDPDYITKLTKKALTRFGRPELTLHKLRYSCCTFLFQEGWDLKRVHIGWVMLMHQLPLIFMLSFLVFLSAF